MMRSPRVAQDDEDFTVLPSLSLKRLGYNVHHHTRLPGTFITSPFMAANPRVRANLKELKHLKIRLFMGDLPA